MDEFVSNSHKYKEEQRKQAIEEKKVEKVVTGAVKTKKNEVRKFADIFISEDIKNVKSYIFMDVLVPAFKKFVADAVSDGINMLLYGGTKGGRSGGSTASKISYRNYYDRREDDRYRGEARPRAGYSYDDVVVETRNDAEEVIIRMHELIDQYGVVSVADLYDLVGESHNYTDNKYGWTNVRNAEVVRVSDGYKIKMPRVTVID